MKLCLLSSLIILAGCGAPKTTGAADPVEPTPVPADRTPEPTTTPTPPAPAGAIPLAVSIRMNASRADKAKWGIKTDEVLRSGDRVEMMLGLNQAAYVYVLQFMPDNTVNLLFPEKGDRLVQPGPSIRIPDQDSEFELDKAVGDEVVYVLVARQPIEHVDAAISTQLKSIRWSAGDRSEDNMVVEKTTTEPPKEDKNVDPKNPKIVRKKEGGAGAGTWITKIAPPRPPRQTEFGSTLKSRGDFLARKLNVVKKENSGSVAQAEAASASDQLLVGEFHFKHE